MLSEIEAQEACKWLRAAGFPQYAQMYEGKCLADKHRETEKLSRRVPPKSLDPATIPLNCLVIGEINIRREAVGSNFTD
jgi:hypothetical protein